MTVKLFWLFIAVLLVGGGASAEQVISEDSEVILTVRLKEGLKVRDYLVAYESPNGLLLPLEELSQALGLDVSVFAQQNKVTGKVLSDEVNLDIQLDKCFFYKNDAGAKFNCSLVHLYEGDLYVDTSLFELWLPLKLEFKPFASLLEIESTKQLPIQLKQIRKNKSNATQGKVDYDPGFPRAEYTPAWFDGFTLDQSLSLGHTTKPSVTSFKQDTQIGAQLLRGELFSSISGTEKSISDAKHKLVWRRKYMGDEKDEQGEKFFSFEVGDIVLPERGLLGGSSMGGGAYFSTHPFYTPDEFDSYEIRDRLPVGWEVELYVNEIFFKRVEVKDDGEYVFEDIPILYGQNAYKLVFYGPQGQSYSKIRNYNPSQSQLKAGEQLYKVGSLSSATTGNDWMFQLNSGLFENITSNFGLSSYLNSNELRNTYILGGLTGYYRSLNLNVSHARATPRINEDAPAYATRVNAKFPILKSNWQLKKDFYTNYQTNTVNNGNLVVDAQTSEFSASSSFRLLSKLSLFSSYEEKGYQTGRAEQTFKQRVASTWKKLNWLVEQSFGYSKEGKTSANYPIGPRVYSGELSYNDGAIQAGELRYKQKFSRSHSLRVSLNSDFQTKTNSLRADYNKLLQTHNYGVSFNYEDTGNLGLTANLFYSFGNKVGTPVKYFSGEAQSDRGNVYILVYRDNNINKVYDEGDIPLKDIRVFYHQGNKEVTTDSRGFAYMTSLPIYRAIDLSIQKGSIQDPRLSPIEEGLRVTLPSGAPYRVELPVAFYETVEGTIYIGEKEKGGVPVELVQGDKVVATTYSESDGLYLFEKVLPGKYSLRVSEKYLKTKQIGVSPHKIYISTDEPDSLVERNFELRVSN